MIDKNIKKQLIERYKQNEQDTGSVEIQIALLTKQIELLTSHCKQNANDFSSRRGLLKMVSKRKKLLNYLDKNKHEKYNELIQSMGIRA